MKTLAVAVSLTVTATILAQAPLPEAPKATATATSAAREEPLRKLSRRERKERLDRLQVRHQDFAADVEPIITPAELDTFLMLETDAQRDAFVDEFWRRRDTAGGVPSTAFRDMYYRRLEVAREQFRRISTDRARMFLLHGPPAAVTRPECKSLLQPIEVWRYDFLKGIGQDVRLLFYKPRGASEFRLWNPIGGSTAVSELLAQESGSISADEGSSRSRTDLSASPYAYISRIQLECREGEEVMRAITHMVQARIELLKIFQPPGGGQDEDVRRILRSMVIPNPGAPKLPAQFSVSYPGKSGSRTDVQMTLLVPRARLTAAEVAGAEVYTLDVTGEVLRDGALWEKYRYRFDYPGDVGGEHLPVVIDRLLRPAEYLSRIKITDAASGAEAIVESPLTVPQIYEEEVAVAEPAAETAEPAAAAIKAEIDPRKPALRIIPPRSAVVSGMQTIDTLVSGEAIKAVEFWLDGRKVATRRSAPFAIDFDFGTIPSLRRVRAVALDAAGKPLTGDEIDVNAGTDPFRVRIISPRVAPHLSGATRVEMDVRVPEGEKLSTVELFWNEVRLATLFDQPFVQTVTIPATEGVGYIRAVARLEDDSTPPVEDVVLINSPAYMEEMNVHLVELPTTVIVNGKPASHLKESAFKVFDEGTQVRLSKFEYVKNLPLSLGLAVDASGSMQDRMAEAQKAGAQFTQNIMRKGDKAFLVAFNSEPEVVQRWSTRMGDLHAGLAKLRAEESTALYDAIVYSLYNFQGIRGQKALVLISDGKDTASKFTWEQALEYARRTAVPVYAIGIGIRGNEVDVRYKLSRLCSETGGTAYYIEQARELQKIYDEIQNELRSQYILGFYPAPDIKPGSKWRELNVEVSEGKARTIRGYFP